MKISHIDSDLGMRLSNLPPCYLFFLSEWLRVLPFLHIDILYIHTFHKASLIKPGRLYTISDSRATSARWRALTLGHHLCTLNPRLQEGAVQNFINRILHAWADVIILCGCAPSELTLDTLRTCSGTQTLRVPLRRSYTRISKL